MGKNNKKYHPSQDEYGSLVKPFWKRIKGFAEKIKIYPSIAFAPPGGVLETIKFFAGKAKGFMYHGMNLGNPTVRKFEKLMAEAEGVCDRGQKYDALAFASGMSATHMLALSLCVRGDGLKKDIIYSESIYGGTYKLFTELLPQLGIRCHGISNQNDIAEWIEAIKEARSSGGTVGALWVETLPNPLVKESPIQELTALGDSEGIYVVVDNTVPTHECFKPFAWVPEGDSHTIVLSSVSKAINGHSNGLGGVIISYEHVIEYLKNAKWIDTCRPVMDWHCALRMIIGLMTLPKRMKQHSANAALLASYIQKEYGEYVSEVYYPFNSSRMDQGGPLMSFRFQTNISEEDIIAFCEKVNKAGIPFAPHIGHNKTIFIYPIETTHRTVIGTRNKSLIRVSVGSESERSFKEVVKSFEAGFSILGNAN